VGSEIRAPATLVDAISYATADGGSIPPVSTGCTSCEGPRKAAQRREFSCERLRRAATENATISGTLGRDDRRCHTPEAMFKGIGTGGRVPLRGRGACLALRDGHVDIHIPYLFGSRPISVPVEGLGVSNPRREVVRHEVPRREFAGRTPMRIIPPARFPGSFKAWNLALMFKTPIDLPRPRGGAVWLWPTFSRRRQGIYGLFVTAVDPAAAPLTLAGWGVELVDDPRGWTEQHWHA
jgi:hypothetical protein